VIATKVGPMLGPDGIPALQATPGQLRGLVRDNLRELGIDHLDLVYLRGRRAEPAGAASRSPNASPRSRSCARRA
jgi:aryl-alcohol dehydrogenase-like predicted oxidoreductase